MVQFPIKEFSEINRVLFTVFNECECETDEAVQAQIDATREVASAERAVKKLFEILKKEAKP